MHGPAAAAFALMAALGGSTMALLGALHPLWRLNMLAMTILTVSTMVAVAVVLPESPIWLMRKSRDAEAEAAMCCADSSVIMSAAERPASGGAAGPEPDS